MSDYMTMCQIKLFKIAINKGFLKKCVQDMCIVGQKRACQKGKNKIYYMYSNLERNYYDGRDRKK